MVFTPLRILMLTKFPLWGFRFVYGGKKNALGFNILLKLYNLSESHKIELRAKFQVDRLSLSKFSNLPGTK